MESRLTVALESAITLTGLLIPSKRQFSIGSSALTVPIPAIIAIFQPLSSCTNFLDSSPDTHLESPVQAAILPSRVIAHFIVTHGLPDVMYFRKILFCFFSSDSRRPHSTSIPCSLKIATPFPATRGLGSGIPTTTLDIPAAMRASVHGGCLPWWQHGSRVTYIVLPDGSSVHAARASLSACRQPYFLCQPFPITRSSLTTTAPTRGLGLTKPFPLSASSMAICI